MTVVKMTDGLGFGDADSSIGVNVEDAALLAVIDSAVQTPNLLIPVDSDDDGCGDGRHVADGQTISNRPKVFGGGAVMSAAILIGLGETAADDPEGVLHEAIKKLEAKNINFGGHTDDYAEAPNCGCGAIDKFPAILVASDTYWRNIRNVITISGFGISGLGDVLQRFGKYAEKFKDSPYSGLTISEEIVAAGKVVKQLAGNHIEKVIILNTVPGHTVNQAFIREQTGGKADAFAVDVWRMREIAEGLYDDPNLQERAFLAEVVYTLATAAVLTRGNLPVYLVT